MRLRTAVCGAVLALGALVPGAVMTAGSRPGAPLTRAEMARLTGSMVNAGKCSITCAIYQLQSGQVGNWNCAILTDGDECKLCSVTGNTYTYPGTTTGDAGACPGQWYTRGTTTQDCGLQSIFGQAHCQGGACTLDQGGGYSTTSCNDPPPAVKQAGH